MESIDLGRRRSLSLDDLGLNGMTSPHSLPLSLVDDTDDDLDDLPSQEEVLEMDVKSSEPEVSSLSTIREASPINSVEEWSPSPVLDEDDNRSISLPDEQNGNSKPKTLQKGLVQNCLTKWKNMIKK